MITVGLSELHGKVLGIVGNIGREVAARVRAFGCRIAYNDVVSLPEKPEGELGVEWMELEELLRESDIVTLHVPLTPDTRHIVEAAKLALMKPDAYLLNLAKGEVIDEEALARPLSFRRTFGCAIAPQIPVVLNISPCAFRPFRPQTYIGMMSDNQPLATFDHPDWERRRP